MSDFHADDVATVVCAHDRALLLERYLSRLARRSPPTSGLIARRRTRRSEDARTGIRDAGLADGGSAAGPQTAD